VTTFHPKQPAETVHAFAIPLSIQTTICRKPPTAEEEEGSCQYRTTRRPTHKHAYPNQTTKAILAEIGLRTMAFLVVLVHGLGSARSARFVSMYMINPCSAGDRTLGGRESLVVIVARVNAEEGIVGGNLFFRHLIDGGESARVGSLPDVVTIARTRGISGIGDD